MRVGNRKHTGGIWAGWIGVLTLLIAGATAFAQDGATIVVCETGDCGGYNQDYDNLEDGVIAAIQLARSGGAQYTTVLLVERTDGSAWEGGFGIPADANITLVGVPQDTAGARSNDIEIEGTDTLPALTIST